MCFKINPQHKVLEETLCPFQTLQALAQQEISAQYIL